MGSRIENALARFEEAVRTHAFKGTVAPARVPGIQQMYDQARIELKKAIKVEVDQAYTRGRSEAQSRARNRPGDGDMGG